jgi:ABC-type Zn uptake system ZnuABC Zn-binding protein ZnuA
MKMNFIFISYGGNVKRIWIFQFAILLLLAISLDACSSPATEEAGSKKLNVLATTSIVADVVSNVGGTAINVDYFLPLGTDPHNYDPTPQDIAKISDADIVFANGAGLEEFLEPLLESAEAQEKTVYVSQGIDLIETTTKQGESRGDPHTWTDPNNVILWVNNIEQKLIETDPANNETYKDNAQSYIKQLEDLDQWIRSQVDQIPEDERLLVTDHLLFAYFADEYGFIQVGAIVPGYSTMAQPSAQDLANLEDAVKKYGVKAIFVGNTVNPELAQRIAEDTNTKLVFVYTGSLSEPGGEADTYIHYMQYLTNAIVENLR